MLLTATAVILAALAFEHIGGYVPCPLCLQQRYAYYAASRRWSWPWPCCARRRHAPAAAVFSLVAAAFVVNAGLGIYQAGAEWKFWDLPARAPPRRTLPSFDINNLEHGQGPALCGVASWRFLGLSFAGWNVVSRPCWRPARFSCA